MAPGGLRAELGAVDEAETRAVFARHLHPVLLRALREASSDSQVDLVRRVLDLIDEPARQALDSLQASAWKVASVVISASIWTTCEP